MSLPSSASEAVECKVLLERSGAIPDLGAIESHSLHEVLNDLSAIRLQVELLIRMSENGDALSDRARSGLQTILSVVQHAIETTRAVEGQSPNRMPRSQKRPAQSPVAVEEPNAPEVASLEVDSRHCRVMYIEDNAANIELMERILVLRPEFKLLTVRDGTLVREAVANYRPELVLLDLNLPGMSGVEILTALQADPDTAQVPVVIVSADATEEAKARTTALGAVDHLDKPYEIEDLFALLDRYCTSSHYT